MGSKTGNRQISIIGYLHGLSDNLRDPGHRTGNLLNIGRHLLNSHRNFSDSLTDLLAVRRDNRNLMRGLDPTEEE